MTKLDSISKEDKLLDGMISNLNAYCMPFLREILETKTIREVLKYGNKNVPYTLMSMFLKLVGNSLLRYIFLISNKRVFKAGNEAFSVQLLTTGETLVKSRNILEGSYKSSEFGNFYCKVRV